MKCFEIEVKESARNSELFGTKAGTLSKVQSFLSGRSDGKVWTVERQIFL